MTVLVLGSAGLAGRHIVARLKELRLDVLAPGGSRTEGNILSSDLRVRWVAYRPTVIVNCAAWTDVDGAENYPVNAFDLNADGAESAAKLAYMCGARLIHLSTNFVYPDVQSAELNAFCEVREHQPRDMPLGVYGRSKLLGDKTVLDFSASNIVLRTSSLYGQDGTNFASTVLSRLQKGETLTLDQDRMVAPTSAIALARQIGELIVNPLYRDLHGIVHFQSHGRTTWLEWGSMVARLAGRPESQIEGKTIQYRAPRPRVLLRCQKLEALCGSLPSWMTNLTESIEQELIPKFPS